MELERVTPTRNLEVDLLYEAATPQKMEAPPPARPRPVTHAAATVSGAAVRGAAEAFLVYGSV